MTPPQASLTVGFLRQFMDVISAEMGQDNLAVVLQKANLSANPADPENPVAFDEHMAAEAYARLQRSLRVYYGRGARGTLLRVGRNLWKALLEKSSLVQKAQAPLIRALPVNLRRKPALDLLAGFLRGADGTVSVHTLDLDLLIADHNSPTTLQQAGERGPICFVTLGLVEEALFWATGREHDVEEISCRATGAEACEFKIKAGG